MPEDFQKRARQWLSSILECYSRNLGSWPDVLVCGYVYLRYNKARGADRDPHFR